MQTAAVELRLHSSQHLATGGGRGGTCVMLIKPSLTNKLDGTAVGRTPSLVRESQQNDTPATPAASTSGWLYPSRCGPKALL